MYLLKNGKQNKLKAFWSIKNQRRLNKIIEIGYGHPCLMKKKNLSFNNNDMI
jgi:hypothetical protein